MGVDMTPVILGFILGPLLDFYFHRAMIADNGNMLAIFSYPIATVAFIVAMVFLFLPLISKGFNKKKNALNV